MKDFTSKYELMIPNYPKVAGGNIQTSPKKNVIEMAAIQPS
jgi:hypothetical protein